MNGALDSNEIKPISLDGLLPAGQLEPVLAVHRPDQAPGELAAWAMTTMQQRWDALLELRERTARWRYGTEPRLERVLAVARLADVAEFEKSSDARTRNTGRKPGNKE